jgi:hypothetical protein
MYFEKRSSLELRPLRAVFLASLLPSAIRREVFAGAASRLFAP